ncbi:hypothetical protein N0V82_007401 [Gnomoniopsis sp. IMI 355080]|nr:hypothetical protein N0V82_007401 [Gnomoniopsis sp. IMI 355080]
MTSPALQALANSFPNEQLLLAGTDEFIKLNKSYLSCLESDLTPAAIFVPNNVDDVAKFVGVIAPFSIDGDMPFAIRGAGQQPLTGCANIQTGVTLDLRKLDTVEIKDGVARIGAGARWGAVYDKVQAQGLGITGSRSALGGIGGLALAGGLSFFSSREGFICDNVVDFEVVLASGKVVNANINENTDLWRALRGAQRHALHEPALRHWDNRAIPGAGPFSAISPQIDQLNSMRVLTLKEAAAEQAQQSADDIRCAYMNTTVKADVETLQLAADEYTSVLESIKSVEGITCSFTLQPYPVSLMEKSKALGGNVLGLDASQGPLVSVLALTWWKSKDDDEKILSTFKGVLDKVDQIAAEKGTAVPFKYLNYAWSSQEPIKSYGEGNVNFLKRVSKEYDPSGLFQKGVPGGFKLFK